ncbi:MAG: Fe-S cluster assembly protein SufD [Rubricoccaceae bacterium]
MTDSPPLFQQALDAYERAYAGDGAPRPFADARARAREAFARLGLPTRRLEAWKYTDLRRALAHDYAFAPEPPPLSPADLDAFRLPGHDGPVAVLVNGLFEPGLSNLSGLPARVTVASLREAVTAHAEVVAQHLGRYADAETDAFTALNSAFDLDGLFVHVPRGVAAERTLHVLHVTTAAEPAFVQSRHLFVAEEASQLSIVETHHVLGRAPTFGNLLAEAFAGRAAVLRHVRLQREGDEAHHVTRFQAQQEAQSDLTALTFTFASGIVRNNVALVLAGEGCQTTLAGVYVTHGEQHVDTSTFIDHAAPGCTSNELYKGILYDRSTGVFNGKVFVRREGQQTNAYQQSQGVVLSPEARHFSKPELEIYADDVKCSHGSTTGSVEPEGLFYLRARGVSEADARALLLYAFAHDVVEMIPMEALRDHVDALITERLK